MNIRYDMVQCFVVRPVGESHELPSMRRASDDFMGGTWQTVYGRIEADETASQAAIRELAEETGPSPAEFYQLDTVNTFYVAADRYALARAHVLRDRESGRRRSNSTTSTTALAGCRATRSIDAFMWPGEKSALHELFREILDNGPAKPHMRIKLQGVLQR